MPLTQVNSGLLESGAALANIGSGNITPAYLNTQAQYTGFKNRLINGELDIWQRGTSFTGTGSLTYFADRWSAVQYAGSTSTVTRQSSGLSGIQYCIRVQRPNGATNTATINLGQSIESVNCLDLAGQSVTISFYARAGANFSSASSLLRCAIYSGTGTDQNLYTGYTGSTDSWQENTLTTSWQKFTFTRTIPSNATEVGVAFYYTPVGTAGANDYYEIAQVQLEKGSTATSFDYRPYGTELQLCQRYYEKSFPPDTAPANGPNTSSFLAAGVTVGMGTNKNSVGTTTEFIVTKRATPTMVAYGNSAGGWAYQAANVTGTTFSASVGIGNITAKNFSYAQQVVDGAAIFIWGHWAASAEL